MQKLFDTETSKEDQFLEFLLVQCVNKKLKLCVQDSFIYR